MVCGTRFQMGSRFPITIHEVNLFLRVLGHVASQHNPGRADYGFALAEYVDPEWVTMPGKIGATVWLSRRLRGCGNESRWHELWHRNGIIVGCGQCGTPAGRADR